MHPQDTFRKHAEQCQQCKNATLTAEACEIGKKLYLKSLESVFN